MRKRLRFPAGRQIKYFKLQLLACGLEQDFVDVHVLWLIAKATIPSICSYKLQLYLSVIKSFVQIHEQQKQLLQNKNLINLGTWAALAGGILVALEVISSIIECIRNFQGYSFFEMVEGLSIVALLVFFIAATIRLWMSKVPIKFFANWPGTLAKVFRRKNTNLRFEPIISPSLSAQKHTPAN